VNGRQQRVHRVSYLHFIGPLPEDKPDVLHKCDNRSCFNPRCLFPGTQSDNNRDMREKNRDVSVYTSQPGETNGNHKLTANDVVQIRSLFQPNSPEFGRKALAKRFGVTSVNIGHIVARRSWAYLP
jgi:hypothetical protein